MSIQTGADYVSQVRRNIHDFNSADFTDNELLSMVNEARTRVALDTHCYRTYLTGLNTISKVETYPYNLGAVGGTNVTAGGHSYTSNTVVSFTGGSGTGATGIASIVGGVIQNIFMTNWGTGYTPVAPPAVVITDSGGGTGAVATPVVVYNVLDVLSMDVLWGSLRLVFGYLPFTGFNTYCRAYANQYSTPGVFTLHQGILKSFIYPIPDQAYPMAWDIITLPTDLANTTSPENQIIAPWNDAVQFYASFLAVASLQQYEKAKFWYDAKSDAGIGGMYGGRIKQLPATAFSRRIFNPYRTYYSMVRKV